MEYIKDYSVIEKDTRWVAKMMHGRHTGTYEELKEYWESEDCRDFDTLAKQPTPELQHFWDAFYQFGQDYSFIYNAKEFFELIYSKCPYAFDKKPERRCKVTTLAEVLVKVTNPEESIMVENCGNHYACNWIDALADLGRNYDVINITKYGDYMCYTVAGTEEELQALSSASNTRAYGYKAW